METVFFLLVSTFEWFALIVLAFTIFKLEVGWYKGQIIFSAFLLGLLSYLLFEVFDLKGFASLLQPPIVFLFFWQMFRIPVFYAGLMTSNGYLAYVVINAIIFSIYDFLGANLQPGNWIMYSAQILSGAVALFLGWLIVRLRIGFSFVPYGDRANVRLTGINLRLLLFTFIGYAVASASSYLVFLQDFTFLFLIVTATALGIFQYLIFKKEYTDDD